MILELVEADKPKNIGEKISEFMARPPLPLLRFYGDFSTEADNGERHILFALRSGVPLPLFYGVYAEARYDDFTDYIEKTDHIGPFSTDDWRLSLDTTRAAQIKIRVGILPFEILADKAEIAI